MPRPTIRAIRERLARWLAPGAETRDYGGYAPGGLAGRMASTPTGAAVSHDSALTISAVFAAVSCYSNTIGALALYIAERDDRGGRRPAPEHPAFELLRLRPNARSTSMRLRQAWIGHACTFGNGYLEIERDARGRAPVALHLMDPRDTRPFEREGSVHYRSGRDGVELPARDVLHLAMFGWDGLRGYSPIEVGRETLGVATAQRDYQAALFNNSAASQGHLELAGNLKSTELAALRAYWNRMHQGPHNAGNVGILEGGMRWVQTNFSPQDSQLILGCKLSVEEVARLWNLPQHKLNALDHATFSNVEELNIDFYQSSILPWVTAIEQECDLKLIAPAERVHYFTFHDVASLLRGNLATQTAQDTADLNSGVKSINEVRISRGLAPIPRPQADYHFVATISNLAPIETLATSPATAPPGPSPATSPSPSPATAPGPAPRALRDVLEDALNRMIRRETHAARRASGRDDFAGWLGTFYDDFGTHLAMVDAALRPAAVACSLDPAEIARGLIGESRARLRDLVVSVPPDELPGAVDRLCSRWESGRAAALADSLLNRPGEATDHEA